MQVTEYADKMAITIMNGTTIRETLQKFKTEAGKRGLEFNQIKTKFTKYIE